MRDTSATLLVVSANHDLFVTMREMLTLIAPRMTLSRETDGETALARARNEQPDVIFLDGALTEPDAIRLCEQLKADPETHPTPIVMCMDVHAGKAGRLRALEYGADCLIDVPFDAAEFEATLVGKVKLGVAGRRDRNERRELLERVKERTLELSRAHRATLNLLEDLHSENEARKLSEDYFRRVSSITTDIAYSCSSDAGHRYSIVWITGAAERITGYDTASIQQRGCWRFLVLDEDMPLFDRHVVAVPVGIKETCELRILHRDGHIVWLASTVECSADPEVDGRTLLFGGLTDITERHRAAEELHAAKNRAEQSERLKDAFIANISHEIRTPLNIILGYTNVIAERFLSAARDGERSFFDSVQRGGERLLRTVDMILNVSRLQSGEYTPHPIPLDLSELIRTIALDHQRLAEEKNLVLCTADETGPVAILADEYSVVQAVSNLVHNAIKFTPQGQVVLRLFRDDSARVCLSVQDTGIGISAEYLPTLFARYSQEEMGYTREYEGLGLGMALVKGYLNLNDAHIAVESIKGQGSTFTITFTTVLDTQPGSPQHRTTPRSEKPRSDDALSPVRRPDVLLVEDDEQTIEFMDVLLGDRFRFHTARTAELAWDILCTSSIELVLMDISLAGEKTGLELTREIRAHATFSRMPIIAVTAHAYDTDREACLAAGCNEFISKPIRKAQLLAIMNAQLEV